MHTYVHTHTQYLYESMGYTSICLSIHLLTFSSTFSSPRHQHLPRRCFPPKLCYLAGPLKPTLTALVKQGHQK